MRERFVFENGRINIYRIIFMQNSDTYIKYEVYVISKDVDYAEHRL